MIGIIKKSDEDCQLINPSSVLAVSEYVACEKYENAVVKKPWGFEYLLFHNDFTAGWVLHIDQGSQTSLHCHPNKKTSLVVLKGKGILRTIDKTHDIEEGDCFIIDKGAFHSTKAVSDLIVLEIESPPKKNDLYRLDDAYGRAFRGYEGVESYSSLRTFMQMPTLYNYWENLGSIIEIGGYTLLIDEHKMIKDKYNVKNAIIGIIAGKVLGGKNPIEPGDVVHSHDFESNVAAVTDSNVINEVLLILKK